MDQLVAALGRRGHALLIDCRSLACVAISVDLADADVVICDSRVKHRLASSEYNVRRYECREGVRLLSAFLPEITALRDVTADQLDEHASELPDRIYRRCRHVVSENERALAAAEAFRLGHLDRAGDLMRLSHESLRDDYEVSCAELDTLVEIALSSDGVFGARMTGGGFGGCTVNLVRRDARDEFERRVAREYAAATGLEVAIFVSGASDGASEIDAV
jgi:galactokinase